MRAEKLEPLLVPMAHLAQAKDLAVGRIQRGKQCDRAVAFVVALTTIPLAGSQSRFFFVSAALGGTGLRWETGNVGNELLGCGL
jgi:hypothetical protein